MLDDDKARDYIHAYLDGHLSDEELRQFSDWIKRDPNNMREFCKIALLHDHLNDAMVARSRLANESEKGSLALQGREHSAAGPGLGSQVTLRRIVWGTVGIALVVLVGIFLVPTSNDVAPSVIPEIVRLDSEVELRLENGTSNAAKIGDRIHPGQTVAARGNSFGSVSATLKYPDGTKLHLFSTTAVTNRGADSKWIAIDHGTVSATVMPQPSKYPMLFTTKKLNVKVLGTDLIVRAAEKTTGVSVTKGLVEVTREPDGRSVDVPAGKRVVLGSEPEFVVEEIRGPSDSWGEDFEDGWPDGWRMGNLVTENLPTGSQGAVQAVLNLQGDRFGIYTLVRWIDGLFVAHPETHLQLTFKVKKVSWFNIFMLSRTGDPENSTTCLHQYTFQDDWIEPDRWYKATIPLSAFLRRSSEESAFEEDPFRSGELVVDMLWSSPGPDRGLVIDEVKVSRGGSGEARITKLED